jgi:hypothetical protein
VNDSESPAPSTPLAGGSATENGDVGNLKLVMLMGAEEMLENVTSWVTGGPLIGWGSKVTEPGDTLSDVLEVDP